MNREKLTVEIDGFSDYTINTDGIIMHKSGKTMNQSIGGNGYHLVQLRKDGKGITKTVHSLLAKAFLPRHPSKIEVNHKDGDRLNNNLNNLEWVTPSENMRHMVSIGRWKLTEKRLEHVREMGRKFGGAHSRMFTDNDIRSILIARASGLSYSKLARKFKTSGSHIGRIVNGQLYSKIVSSIRANIHPLATKEK